MENSAEPSIFELIQEDRYTELGKVYESQHMERDQFGFTPVMLAATLNRTNCLRAIDVLDFKLAKMGYMKRPVVQHEQTKETALIMAVKQRNNDAAKSLMREVGYFDSQNYSALAYALMSKNDELIELLAPAESQIRIQGLTALQFAVFCGLPKYFALFKHQLNQFSIPSRWALQQESTALCVAAMTGRVSQIELCKSEAGLQDCDGQTALMRVIDLMVALTATKPTKPQQELIDEPYVCKDIEKLQECALELMKLPGEVGKKDSCGRSALMRAASGGQSLSVIASALHQAEHDLVDKDGKQYQQYMQQTLQPVHEQTHDDALNDQ